jgi:hypothetical protein
MTNVQEGEVWERDSVKWLPGMYPATNLRVERSVPVTRNLSLARWIPDWWCVVRRRLIPMRIELLGLDSLVVVLIVKSVSTIEMV